MTLSLSLSLSLSHTHTHTHTHIYIYIYIYRIWQHIKRTGGKDAPLFHQIKVSKVGDHSRGLTEGSLSDQGVS